MTHLTEQEKKALALFKARAVRSLPDHTATIQLFGSKARGDAQKHSDLDVLVIVADGTWHDRIRLSEISAHVMGETNVLISPKLFTRQQWQTMKQERAMFWQTIKHDLVDV